MKKALMIIAIVAIVAIAGSMIYYFIFFRPEKERAEIKLQEEKLEFEKEKQRSTEISIEKDKEDKAQQELNKKSDLAEKLGYLDRGKINIRKKCIKTNQYLNNIVLFKK